LSLAVQLGCELRRRGGEIILSHPAQTKKQIMQDPTRRKDASRALVTWLRRIQQATTKGEK
jgi:hypothetical protein